MYRNYNLLEETARLIAEKGLQVYRTVWSNTNISETYFYFTDGKNIGYCQTEYGGVKFSSQHKPSKEFGTGYALQHEPFHEVDKDLIDKMVEKAFTPAHPEWAAEIKTAPQLWESWEEFTRKNASCEYVRWM